MKTIKFYNTKRGDLFKFAYGEDQRVFVSHGVDGAYGRFVREGEDHNDHNLWNYCSANEDVVVLPVLE